MFSFSRFADYLRSVAALNAVDDAEKQRAIAELLRLVEAVPEAPPEIPTAIIEPSVTQLAEPVVAPARESAPALRPTPERRTVGERRRSVNFSIRPVAVPQRERPEWLDESEILDPPRNTSAAPAPPQPLFPRRSARAVLSTSMATQTETNQVDLQAMLDAELEGRMLVRIPRRMIPSLSRGIQVIVDRGPSAAPFDADQKLLVDQIRSVGGRETISVIDLDPSSDFLAASETDEWDDYFARYRPPPYVTVALVSDLGIARVPFEQTAGTEEWSRFIGRIRAAGNHVVAFVPYAPARWPQSLSRQAALVQWDRRTTVQSVRRALRRSRP